MNSKQRVFILGNGYVGSYLLKNLKKYYNDCINVDRKIYTSKTFNNFLKERSDANDIVINCAAYIGINSIKDCDDNIDLSLETNSELPCRLLYHCIDNKLKFVHISTGGLFQCQNNTDVFSESDVPNNASDLVYYFTKYLAEIALQGIAKKHSYKHLLIPRIHMPISEEAHPNNLLSKLTKYDTIIDNTNTITLLPEFVEYLAILLNNNSNGVYNAVNSTSVSMNYLYSKISNTPKPTLCGKVECVLSNEKLLKETQKKDDRNSIDHLLMKFIENSSS